MAFRNRIPNFGCNIIPLIAMLEDDDLVCVRCGHRIEPGEEFWTETERDIIACSKVCCENELEAREEKESDDRINAPYDDEDQILYHPNAGRDGGWWVRTSWRG